MPRLWILPTVHCIYNYTRLRLDIRIQLPFSSSLFLSLPSFLSSSPSPIKQLVVYFIFKYLAPVQDSCASWETGQQLREEQYTLSTVCQRAAWKSGFSGLQRRQRLKWFLFVRRPDVSRSRRLQPDVFTRLYKALELVVPSQVCSFVSPHSLVPPQWYPSFLSDRPSMLYLGAFAMAILSLRTFSSLIFAWLTPCLCLGLYSMSLPHRGLP